MHTHIQAVGFVIFTTSIRLICMILSKFKSLTIAVPMLLSAFGMHAADISFVGQQREIISITPDKNTGLNTIFVAYDVSQISEMRISGVSASVQVSKYGNLGGGFAEPVNVTFSSGTALLANPEGDMGYIIEDGGTSTYIWLVNYLPKRMKLESVEPATIQDCTSTTIDIVGSGGAIHYYTIDGRQAELSREIKVDYTSAEWNEEEFSFSNIELTKVLSHLTSEVMITPPVYSNTTFVVTGDRFMEQWGFGLEVESVFFAANGLETHTRATQTNLPEEDPDAPASNAIRTETIGMGGSAPVDISFESFSTEGVIHHEWQIAADTEFEYIDYRFNTPDFDYTFTQEGTYYVRYVGSNADGSCETIGETYVVSIGASDLRIPNAFTPNGDGVNDEWKVGYRSLLSFHCTIFDRYGNEICSFSDPALGWDGKYKGKFVNPGVYFYVIEATGSDGRKYKKGGDINLIRSKRYAGSSSSEM